ncbi:sodium/dicarboxylare symporter [Staphylococcus aureus M1423]|jgi:L-cystine uptake protein TcyP (sodium:dicarboxylate symporter family)|uniref:L-cystine uptake protein TcyP n=5 Tax=Staphylococcus aureus TaxID=1280 RepID=A0A3A3AFP1_STAAU|nr:MULTISPECIES: L-cystine transporter [Staphylococcus]EGL91701.1 transporter, dicarboxylate/amino acid:cation Na+/H+ symporter family protein [Staphylococcus aureus subsp. aureus 21318]EHS15301.1 transporter, dicarboxylate/amino acid:cation Na+/H+ symporter family protein [Staphylococcus aureus subsp. aureus IS-99]ENK69111.1 sodium/dicarboxylare symporter [Staphylococcus aureus M0562]EUY49102.1 sodium/dicarboxylare symporter [Staphylococcus aureus M0406]HAR4217785.1 L-cystine transporter [Sta
MNAFLTLINIIVLVIFIVILHMMARKHISFAKRVFTALGIGIVFGVLLHLVYGTHSNVITSTSDWFNIVGQGYVALLQMIVMPLIFISIVAAFTKIQIGEKFAKIGSLIFIFLIGTVTIAAIVGVVYALVFGLDASTINLGNAEQARGSEIAKQAKDLTAHTLPQQILELLPKNPFLDFTGQRATSTIAVVIFASFIGFAYLRVARKQPDHGELLKRAIDAIYSLVMAIVTFVLRLTPYGVLAIMANTLSTSDFGAIWTLGKFLIASYAALITMYIIHLIILSLLGISPIRYVKKTLEVLIFAFTSRSSAGALPLNVQTQTRRLGVPEGIANFAATFGLSIGQNGCAGIYPAMLAIMVAPVANVEIDLQFIVTLIAVVIISSFGVAGVGGGATFASILVLSTLNLPVALAGVLISVEPLIDMGRTALNVNDSMLAGTGTAKLTKHWDKDTFESNDNAALTSH